jgi:hypothetical protein
MSPIPIDVDVTVLDELLPELDQPRVTRFVDLADGDITIRRPAALPEKFGVLMRESAKFRLSWERQRADLRDQTLSGYEMSLASIAANAGWTTQEICNLLVAFREKENGQWHGRSYYRATIGKALGQAAKHRQDQQQGAFQNPSEEAVDQDARDADDRSKLVARLNSAFMLKARSLRFSDVVRRGSCYVAFDDLGHEVQLGTVREMNAFVVTQASIAEVTGVNLSIPSGKKAIYWLPVVELFIAIAHSKPIAFDYGLEEETRTYLARALNALTANSPDHASLVEMGRSDEIYKVNRRVRYGLRDEFLYQEPRNTNKNQTWPRFALWGTDGRLYVQVTMLQMFLGTPVGGNERVTNDRLKQGLATMSFVLDKVKTGEAGDDKISVRWCVSPEDFRLDPGCDPQPGLRSEDPRESRTPAGRHNGMSAKESSR